MKINIEYEFRDGPYGGANQFLKCLRDYFRREGVYAETAQEADCILINHTNISARTLEIKRSCPEKILLHRMDGPVSKHRERSRAIDKQAFLLDRMLMDGSVFQSKWTEENCYKLGLKKNGHHTVIHNAPDPGIFYPAGSKKEKEDGKIRLVATSWSPNRNKGFDILEYLDQTLDFDRYRLTFIGNSPVSFRHIEILEPLTSAELGKKLREYDIYLAVSRNESCSNSLLEAMNCGLAAVGRDSGCYREVIGRGGEIVQGKEEFPEAIRRVSGNLAEYQKNIPVFSIENQGKKYYDFAEKIYQAKRKGQYQPKRLTRRTAVYWRAECGYIKIYRRLMRLLDQIAGRGKT